jgi:hypothetical protein
MESCALALLSRYAIVLSHLCSFVPLRLCAAVPVNRCALLPDLTYCVK